MVGYELAYTSREWLTYRSRWRAGHWRKVNRLTGERVRITPADGQRLLADLRRRVG